MPRIFIIPFLKTTLSLLIVAVAMIGCSKKEDKQAVAAPADPDTNAVATIPGAAIPAPTDINQAFTEVDAALKGNDYNKAAQTLLAVQNQQLTDQQAQQARSKMIGLQHSLATAIANGDPNAKAAGELLQSSSMHVK